MTERLYYHDSFLREFTAQVLRCEPVPPQYLVVLDRTAFYPTSGGQPHDTGTLGEAQVLDVVEMDDGTIAHFTDRALAPGPVNGTIDWPRRFDHMQQHTGQHLLSAAFLKLFDMPTVSFHLGREVSTIDLAAKKLDAEQAAEAERLVNGVVQSDLKVEVRYRTAEEAEALGVRKKVEREGPLRVVELGEFDRQPCGGTHVARTGQVGVVQVRKIEKQKQNWRVEFVCGERALAAARADFRALAESAQLLSCGISEVPAMLRKALEERSAANRTRQRLQERLAAYEAQLLLAQAAARFGPRIVTQIFEEAEPSYLRLLATALVAESGACVFLATHAGAYVIFAQSAGGPHDMNALLRECVGSVGGKGGGTHDFAQGSVPDPSELERVLRTALQRLGR